MRATRRNVLVILGVLTIAGGALFGTGAFTQVEAQRSVTVDTAGDSSALLALNITDGLEGSNGDTIAFEESDINLDATTRFNGSLEVTNNGDNPINIEIQNSSTNNDLIGSTGSPMYFEGPSSISAGQTVTYDVVFDTTGSTSAGDVNFPGGVTIVANEV